MCNQQYLFQKIISFNYNFPNSKWNNISKSAIDLIKKCLVDEKKRLTALELSKHDFLKKEVNQFKKIDFDIPGKIHSGILEIDVKNNINIWSIFNKNDESSNENKKDSSKIDDNNSGNSKESSKNQ